MGLELYMAISSLSAVIEDIRMGDNFLGAERKEKWIKDATTEIQTPKV